MNPTCPSCGQSLQPGARRCPNCGQDVASGAERLEQVRRLAWELLERLSRLAQWLQDRLEAWLRRLPGYGRLAPYLGFRQLLRYRRWFTLAAFVVPLLLGLYASPYGHIDTTPFIYQFMALLSYFNPVLGVLGGLTFGVADFVEKLFTNQIYGMTGNIGDYLGARLGYLLAYLSVILMGVLPGVLARVFQAFARRLAPRRVNARSGSGLGSAESGINWLELGAGVVGGMLGGGIAGGLAIPLNFPAFYLRPNPDTSCYSAAVSHLRRLIPAMSLSGGAGPALDAGTRVLAPGAGTRAVVPDGTPSGPDAGSGAGPQGPTTDRIYDGENAVRVLKELNLYYAVRSLDPDDPQYWEKFDRIFEQGAGDRRVVGTAFDRGGSRTGPVDMDDLVIIVREPAQPLAPVTQAPPEEPGPTSPPEPDPSDEAPEKTVVPPPPAVTEEPPPEEPPPPIEEFTDRWRQRLEQVRSRIRFLEGEKKKLEQDYARRYAQWEHCRKSAVSDGLVDIADIAVSTFTRFSTSGFGQAYAKDAVKTKIKSSLRNALRPDSLPAEPAPEGGASDQPSWSDYLLNPIGIGFPPSGGLKQVIQDYATKKQKVAKKLYRATRDKAFKQQKNNLKRLNPIYGFAESMSNFVQQTKSYMDKCEQFRIQMGGIRNRLSNINSALEDLRMDEAEAQAAVGAAERPY